MTSVQFLDFLRRSQIADVEHLRDTLGLGDAEQLAAGMVKAGVLTQWQADKLLAGKWKGFILDDFTLLRHLRKTAISQEYLAEHTLTKRKVVLTVAPPQFVDTPGFLDRFCREADSGPLHRNGMTCYLVRDHSEGDEGGQ